MLVGSGVKLLLAQCAQLLLGRTWPEKKIKKEPATSEQQA